MAWKKKSTKKSATKTRRFRKPNYRKYAIAETKHFDKRQTITINQSGSLQLLSDITSQGVDDTQRIGDQIYLKNLIIDMNFIGNPASSNDLIRYLIILDKQGYNAPTVTDIFEPAAIPSGFSPLSQYNHYYMSRFKILRSGYVRLDSTSYGSAHVKKNITIKVHSHYIGTSTFKNQVYLLLIGDQSNLLTLPICNYLCRFYYTDN